MNNNPYAYGPYDQDNRFGGVLAPFILGGITGGLLAPAFYPRPCCNYPMPYPAPYPAPYPVSTYNYYSPIYRQ